MCKIFEFYERRWFDTLVETQGWLYHLGSNAVYQQACLRKRFHETISVWILQQRVEKIDLFQGTGQDFFKRCNIPWQEKYFSYNSAFIHKQISTKIWGNS